MTDFFDDFESGLGAWTTTGVIATSTDQACDFTHSLKCLTTDTLPSNWVSKSGLTGLGDDARWLWCSFGLFVVDWSTWWQSGLAMDPRVFGFGKNGAWNQYFGIEPQSSSTGLLQFAPGGYQSALIPDGQWVSVVVGFRHHQASGDIDLKLVVEGSLDVNVTGNQFASIGNPIDFISLGDRNDFWGSPFTNESFYIDKFSYQVDTQLADVVCTGPPVLTETPTNVQARSATFEAEVNPEGVSSSVYFEYGLTTSYGTTTPSQAIGSGSSPVPVSQAVSGLRPGRTYHYRAVRVP